jgi:hypothetical protein
MRERDVRECTVSCATEDLFVFKIAERRVGARPCSSECLLVQEFPIKRK